MELPTMIESETVETKTWWTTLKRVVGPGFVVAIAYLDPGNLQADIQSGSNTAYRLTWTVMWATFLSMYIQVLCIRLSIYKKADLAQASGEIFPTSLRFVSWFLAEYSTIITDIPEVIGMGIAGKCLFGLPHYAGVLISFFSTMIFLSSGANTVSSVEYVAAFFMMLLCITMFVEWSYVSTDAGELVRGLFYGFVDTERSDAFDILAIVGCVVMPHNLYLHSGCIRARPDVSHDKKKAVFLSTIELIFPLLISICANIAVIVVAAELLFGIENSIDVGVVNFSHYLASVAAILWGLALLSSAQSSCVTTTYTGQFVMEGFLNWKVHPAVRAGVNRCVTIIPCLFVAIFSNDKGLNICINFVNSSLAILLPFALTPLVKFVSSPEYMGEEGAPSPFHATFMHGVAFIVYVLNAVMLVLPGAGFLGDFIVDDQYTTVQRTFFIITAVLSEIFYLGFNLWVVFTPLPPCGNTKTKQPTPDTKTSSLSSFPTENSFKDEASNETSSLEDLPQ